MAKGVDIEMSPLDEGHVRAKITWSEQDVGGGKLVVEVTVKNMRRRSIISPTGPDKNRTYFVPAFTFTILIPTTVVAASFMTTTFPALFVTPAFFATFAAFFMILRIAWACTFFLTFRTAWASLGFVTALLSTSGCRRCKYKTCGNDGR